jgi:hypothetical protein
LHLNQTEKVLIALMTYLRFFFNKYGTLLFGPYSDLALLLCDSLMALCNSTVSTIREQAAATAYIFTRTSFVVSKNPSKAQFMMTVALSRTLQRTIPEKDELLNSIRSFISYAEQDPNNPQLCNGDNILKQETGSSDQKSNNGMLAFLASIEAKLKELDMQKMRNFNNTIKSLCEGLEKLLQDTVSVNQTTSGKDLQRTEDLLYRISEFYERIPELRFFWLRRLANFHKQNNQYEEAVQCYYRIAAVVFNYLRESNSPIIEGLPLDNFYSLNPNLSKMKNSLDLSGITVHSNEFTEHGLIALLRTIVETQALAEQYEHAIPILKILIPLFERSEDYANLSATHGSIKEMFELINTSIKENSRFYSTYYRLQFFGEAWGPELNGKHFIYKMGKLFKLYKMKSKLTELFGSDIELITTPKKVDVRSLDPTKRYLQFTNVKPLLEEEEDDEENLPFSLTRKRKTKFESQINISKFYYETVFKGSKDKKVPEKVTNVHKKKVILRVKNSFPDVKTRLPVIKEKERILTPIEAAIENMQAQICKLENVLELNPPDISQLQLVLQGSVRAGVNGGPKDIVISFLSKFEYFKYNREHVNELRRKCHYFLFLCEQALKKGKHFTKSNEVAMYSELEKGFNETKSLFEEHLGPSTGTDTLIQEYQQREQKSSTDYELINSDIIEDILQFGINELEIYEEDEVDELLPIPYNRNYRLSSKEESKKISLLESLRVLDEDSQSQSPSTPV